MTIITRKLKIAAAVVAALGVMFSSVSCREIDNKKNTPEKETVTQEPATTPASGAIVYFNLDRVISEFDMANELSSAVETKVAGIQEELNRRGNKLQTEFNAFNDKMNKGLITRSTAEYQAQKLQEKQNNFNVYANTKQQEMAEEQQVMLNRIGNAIKEFVDKYNAEKKYLLILSTTGDILPAPVVTGDVSLDITEDIIEGLNKDYLKNKDKKVSDK